MKNLIVYFSHDQENYVSGKIKKLDIGNTKIVAMKLNNYIDADLFEIKPLHDYPYIYRETTEQAKIELNENRRPKIKNIVSHIEDYDHIYLGFPNWWSTMPMCVWTFLESYDFSNKTIHPFITHEGSGFSNSLNDLKKICPNSIITKGLAIKGSTVLNSDEKIKKWIKEN